MFETKPFESIIQSKINAYDLNDYRKGRECNIRVKDVLKLHKKQNGKCHWCDIEYKTTNYGLNDLNQFSVDRLDNKIGHVRGNCVLTCWNCNYQRNIRKIN
jgi:hypothetical protein